MGIFSKFARASPKPVPTDRVIPLRFWDDLHYLRSLCHDFTLKFDDVLDVIKLEKALGRLVQIGDWGQIGARLRLNVRSLKTTQKYTNHFLEQRKIRISHSSEVR
jgi:hypothetical protein